MEKVRKLGEKVKEKAGQGLFDILGEVLGSIDAFDQVAELLKTIVPLKAEITVKGKKAVEVRALIRNGELWVGFRRLKKPDEEATEEAEEVDTETEE